jgi:hypothetical protein
MRGVSEFADRRQFRVWSLIVQFLGGPSPVVPRMAEKDVPKVRQIRSLFDGVAERCESPHLGRSVHHWRTGSRPARPCAAAGPAPAAPARRLQGEGIADKDVT